MALFCSVCKSQVPEGFGQCLACKAGFAPQLACEMCRRLVPRGAAECSTCARTARQAMPLPVENASPAPTALMASSRMPSLPSPRAISIVAPNAAPAVLPGLPSHVGLSVVPEQYNAGRFGVTATVTVPALDVEVMNELGQVVVVAHTIASRISASLMEAARVAGPVSTEKALISSSGQGSYGPSVVEIINEMAQFVVILHRTADRMNHFQGFMESTRQLIREVRLLATDLQGEIEAWRMTQVWAPTPSLRAVIRQCRVLATEMQNEIETRRGPQG
jgi:hypothetical protein